MSYICIICNNKYKSPQSLWNHKNRFHQIIKPNVKLELNFPENKTTVMTQEVLNNETNNKLSNYDKRFILDKSLEYLVYLIEINDFTKSVPKKYICYNETVTTNKKCKIFDMILSDSLKKMEYLSNDKSFTAKQKQDYDLVIDRLKLTLIICKPAIKKYYNEKKLLSCDYKVTSNDAWEILDNLRDLVNELKNNKIIDKSSLSTQNKTIKMNDKEYIIDGHNVYVKKSDNSQGELYGVYLNGKIKKTNKQKEIEV